MVYGRVMARRSIPKAPLPFYSPRIPKDLQAELETLRSRIVGATGIDISVQALCVLALREGIQALRARPSISLDLSEKDQAAE